jgi:hypothetical protein
MTPQEWGHAGVCSIRNSHDSVAYTQVSSANRASCVPGCARASFMYKLYSIGTRMEPCGTPNAFYLGEKSSPSTEILNCLLVKKVAIHLMRLENCSSESLCSTPGCYAVSKSFSISKNRAYIDILLLKLRETWSVCHICCDVHGSQTDLRLASFFLQCVYELFLELISLKVCP